MVLCDIRAMRYCIRFIKKHQLKEPVVYVLTCRIGPWFGGFARRIFKLGGTVCLNPDGHEWMRAKWPLPVKLYWRMSEHMMVRRANRIICDSLHIEEYIQKEYCRYHPASVYIPYGAELPAGAKAREEAARWLEKKGVSPYSYYLVVGRFVPENNVEAIIRGVMRSHTKRSLLLITNAGEGRFMKRLRQATAYEKDPRIRFVGTVYEEPLLQGIRMNAYGYIHGHEVGGTNPSLLEALASTRLNLLLDVGFNREVGEDGALYWKKDELHLLIDRAETLGEDEIERLGRIARSRITDVFNWERIEESYQRLFLE